MLRRHDGNWVDLTKMSGTAQRLLALRVGAIPMPIGPIGSTTTMTRERIQSLVLFLES
jgi:hypothetical protein